MDAERILSPKVCSAMLANRRKRSLSYGRGADFEARGLLRGARESKETARGLCVRS
jgi:hypothetical protein